MASKSHNKRIGIAAGVSAALLLAACGADPTGAPQQPTPAVQWAEVPVAGQAGYEELAQSRDVAAAAAWRIALDLNSFHSVQPQEPNQVTSATGLYLVLAMLGEGVSGEAETELAEYLGLTGTERSESVNLLLRELQYLAGDPAEAGKDDLPDRALLHIANHVVVDDEYELTQEYVDAVMSAYGAQISVTDLNSDSGKNLLDGWVRENTGGLIPNSAIEPSESLALVLQNALVMAARWSLPFDTDETWDRDFTLADGTVIQAESMAQESSFIYAEANGWQAVRLPYRDGMYSDVILPPIGTATAELDTETHQSLLDALARNDRITVKVQLPKVDIQTQVDLVPYLRDRLPQTSAGGRGAFAKLLKDSAHQDFALSQAAQSAMLRIDEEGTVAAVVTEMGYDVTSMPPQATQEFIVDRPYLFTISEQVTNWPLVVAHIGDPTHNE